MDLFSFEEGPNQIIYVIYEFSELYWANQLSKPIIYLFENHNIVGLILSDICIAFLVLISYVNWKF